MKFGPQKRGFNAAVDWLHPKKLTSSPESFAEDLKELVNQNFAAALKSAGFRKRRNTFNRAIRADFIHELKFWAMPTTSAAQGKFQLHCGIFLPEKVLYSGETLPKNWINDHDCCLRISAGPWSIRASNTTIQNVTKQIEHAFALLNTFENRGQILKASEYDLDKWQEIGLSVFFEPPLGILKSCLYLADKNIDLATREIGAYLQTPNLGTGHAIHVTQWAKQQGLDIMPTSKP